MTEETPEVIAAPTEEAHGEIAADANTMFILDLIRQKREAEKRMRKDHLIMEMAYKQKKKMEGERQGKKYEPKSYAYGGFVGVQNIQGSGATPSWKKKKKPVEEKSVAEKPEPTKSEESKPDKTEEQPESRPDFLHQMSRADLMIMGMLQDEREHEHFRQHNIIDDMAAVPSESKWTKKFER